MVTLRMVEFKPQTLPDLNYRIKIFFKVIKTIHVHMLTLINSTYIETNAISIKVFSQIKFLLVNWK